MPQNQALGKNKGCNNSSDKSFTYSTGKGRRNYANWPWQPPQLAPFTFSSAIQEMQFYINQGYTKVQPEPGEGREAPNQQQHFQAQLCMLLLCGLPSYVVRTIIGNYHAIKPDDDGRRFAIPGWIFVSWGDKKRGMRGGGGIAALCHVCVV